VSSRSPIPPAAEVIALEPAAHTAAGLDAAWAGLAAPGSWFSGAERVEISREVRAARGCALCAERKAALSPNTVGGEHASARIDAVHRISSDPGRLSQPWFDETVRSGLTPEQVVEIAGVVGVVTIADTLSRALGQPGRELPEPQPGEPSRERVAGAVVAGGWVPMVAVDRAEGPVRAVYEQIDQAAGFVFNIVRALTAVPEAMMGFFAAFRPNYNTHGPVSAGGLARPQVELLASSTSAINDCFY
jgi:hypothetical protein